jgi:hypothetical protein
VISGEATYTDRGSNQRPTALDATTLTITLILFVWLKEVID